MLGQRLITLLTANHGDWRGEFEHDVTLAAASHIMHCKHIYTLHHVATSLYICAHLTENGVFTLMWPGKLKLY